MQGLARLTDLLSAHQALQSGSVSWSALWVALTCLQQHERVWRAPQDACETSVSLPSTKLSRKLAMLTLSNEGRGRLCLACLLKETELLCMLLSFAASGPVGLVKPHTPARMEASRPTEQRLGVRAVTFDPTPKQALPGHLEADFQRWLSSSAAGSALSSSDQRAARSYAQQLESTSRQPVTDLLASSSAEQLDQVDAAVTGYCSSLLLSVNRQANSKQVSTRGPEVSPTGAFGF